MIPSIVFSTSKKCIDCKYYPGQYKACPKTNQYVDNYSYCRTSKYIVRKMEFNEGDELDVGDKEYCVVGSHLTQDGKIVVVLLDPVFPFEPKEER